mmetsp:Transcript_146529/g.470069  ORF Transcript_146529/g.470069 Transcript_146529/m.470069 type:complete len:205 (-) Transcript_146529:305-919(-)
MAHFSSPGRCGPRRAGCSWWRCREARASSWRNSRLRWLICPLCPELPLRGSSKMSHWVVRPSLWSRPTSRILLGSRPAGLPNGGLLSPGRRRRLAAHCTGYSTASAFETIPTNEQKASACAMRARSSSCLTWMPQGSGADCARAPSPRCRSRAAAGGCSSDTRLSARWCSQWIPPSRCSWSRSEASCRRRPGANVSRSTPRKRR